MQDKARLAVIIGVLAGCVVVAFTVPIPSPAELRSTVATLGMAAPIGFFACYAVLCALPLPRTAFNLASGLLLGHVLGIAVALAATAAAGLLGYRLARLIRSDRFDAAVQVVNDRLGGGSRARIVSAVASLRLIPVVPFAPMSYCCGLLSTPLRPYLLGTAVGSVPGTVAVVVVGDAMTGATPPALVAWYIAFALVGAVGVAWAVRKPEPVRVAEDIRG